MSEHGTRIDRRQFLAGTAGSLAVRPKGTTGGPEREASGSTSTRRGAPGFPLWCDRGGLVDPTRPGDEVAVRRFVERCAAHGVERLLPWNGVRP